jgi:hypothetical protein
MATDAPLSLELFLDITATLTHDFLTRALQNSPQQHQQEVKEYLHQLYNEVASNVLDSFAPEIQLRPDITEEVILDLEAKRFTDELKKLSNVQ